MKRKTTISNVKKTKEDYNPSDWDESQSVEVTPEPQLKTGISTSIRLPMDMIKKLRRITRRKGDIG
jgi:hypothetical protein